MTKAKPRTMTKAMIMDAPDMKNPGRFVHPGS